MAEFAQLRLEESVPELERVQKLQLMSKKEISVIIKRRKVHEYRIQRSLKSKDDYLNYIKYELNVLMLLKLRQHKLRAEFKEFKLVRSAVCKRIRKLFQQAVLRYPSDVKLWLSYIEFCRRVKFTSSISSVYTSMLKVHNNKPDLWMSAARWEWEENKSANTARQLLLRAVRFLPKSKLLFAELFRMELLNTQIERRNYLESHNAENAKDAMESDPIMSGKIAETIYRNAVEGIKDVDFFVQFLRICREFEFTEVIREKIYADLEKVHPKDVLSLTTSAIRPLDHADDPGADINDLEQQCISNFEAAVKSVPTEKMWSMYIEFCSSRLSLRRALESKKNLISRLLGVFYRAHKLSLLAERFYTHWVELASEHDHSKSANILRMATERFPKKGSLWIERIRHAINSGTMEKRDVFRIFSDAFKAMPTEAAPDFWKLAVRWNVAVSPDSVDKVIASGMGMSLDVAECAKLFQLERTALLNGLTEARFFYSRNWSAPPVSLEFLYKMLEIEEAAPIPSIIQMRDVMEHACKNFGKKDIDVWLRFVEIERKYADVASSQAALVHSRAIKRLSPELVDQFIALHSLSTHKMG